MTQPSDTEPAVRFAVAILNLDGLLPSAIEWIADNLQPGDVFPSEKLEQWARAAGFQRPA